ncbi:UNVERIFIED_CONTAM: TetR/AcrR family transcriptional repressor of nem operon [Brevibacillus sp. OAP136]
MIETAADLFLREGYAQTSMDDVMQISRVSKSNIYYHFQGKEDLLLAVVEYWVDMYETAIAELVVQHEKTVKERMQAFIDMLTTAINARDCQGGCPFVSLYVQSPRDAGQVKQRITRFFAELPPVLTRLFEQGVARGEFRPDVSAASAAALFIAALEGALVLAETTQHPEMIQETATHFYQLLQG